MDKCRFISGLPEKIGGWVKTIDTLMEGVPRGMRDWRDNSQNVYLGVGTNLRLYALAKNNIPLNEIEDITPLRAAETGTLTNPFDTTNGSAVVLVNDVAHGQEDNDYVMLTAASAVGGLLIRGVFQINYVDPDSYEITMPTNASGTASGGGATAYEYYRIILTDPFDTVSGSSLVTVNQTAHGATSGDFVIIDGASAVGGVTPDGEYQILTAGADSYVIDVGTAASSTATGGGDTSFQYLLQSGLANNAEAFGYGTGAYGELGYGEVSDSGIILNARIWCLAKYGQQLMANPTGGTIYVWDPTVGGRALPLYGAPTMILAMFVTPERFIVALGCLDDSPTGVEGNPMQLRWPDQSNNTNWTSTATNTANEGRTLQEGSFLINGIAVRSGVSLIFSNTACYEMTYTGDNNIYATQPSGDKNGLMGPLAVTVLGGIAYWLSPQKEFWHWNGGATPLNSDDIRDFVFNDINMDQAVKCVVGSHVAKKEIWYFYCSATSNEIDRYVIFHIDQGCFSCGTLERTSWIDIGLFAYPLATDSAGQLYYQENGNDNVDQPIDAYIEFSPVDIAKGERNMDIMGFIPDFQRQSGDISLEMLGKTYPQQSSTVYGPYTIADDATTPRIDLRIGSKMIGFKLQSNSLGGDFRLGLPRVEIAPAGARR